MESEVGMGANIERDKLKTRKDKLAGYFFDISKLSFGAMVLGGLTPMITGEFDYMNLLYVLFGVCMTILFAMVGNRILKYWYMDTMILLFGLGSLIGGGLLIWTYTESGKKWLKSL